MAVRLNFRIITRNHAADSKIGSPKKIDVRADGTHESHPTVWELSVNLPRTLESISSVSTTGGSSSSNSDSESSRFRLMRGRSGRTIVIECCKTGDLNLFDELLEFDLFIVNAENIF